jgi:tetratricopeptide (TPR) repeat protein
MALVWKRIGEALADEAEPDSDDGFDEDDEFDRDEIAEQDQLKARAIKALEESLRLDPSNVQTHLEFVNAYELWNEPDKAAVAARRLLEAFPKHFETLTRLSTYHSNCDEYDQALDFLEQARALKPLDEQLREQEMGLRINLAHQHAWHKRWDKGRAELARAEALNLDQESRYVFLALQAVLELAVSAVLRAEECIAAAQELLDEPAPLWLTILIEGTKFGLSKDTLSRYEQLWQAALAKKGKSATAGELARTVLPYAGAKKTYEGQMKHIIQVLSYIKQSSRIRFEKKDLISICRLFEKLPLELPMFEKLTKRGLKNFPDSPVFIFMNITYALKRGRGRLDPQEIVSQLQQALKLAQTSSDREDAQLVPALKETLSQFMDVLSHPFGLPFGRFRGKMYSSFVDTFPFMRTPYVDNH